MCSVVVDYRLCFCTKLWLKNKGYIHFLKMPFQGWQPFLNLLFSPLSCPTCQFANWECHYFAILPSKIALLVFSIAQSNWILLLTLMLLSMVQWSKCLQATFLTCLGVECCPPPPTVCCKPTFFCLLKLHTGNVSGMLPGSKLSAIYTKIFDALLLHKPVFINSTGWLNISLRLHCPITTPKFVQCYNVLHGKTFLICQWHCMVFHTHIFSSNLCQK